MNTDEHGFNRRKQRERRGGKSKIMKGKSWELKNLRFELSKVNVCAAGAEVNHRDAKSAEVKDRMSSLRFFASLRFNVLDERLESPDRKSTRLNSSHGYISYA